MGRIPVRVFADDPISQAGVGSRWRPRLLMVADGMDTAEIARRLSFGERTIKSVIHDITTRLQVRNRTHAVAYALREGLI